MSKLAIITVLTATDHIARQVRLGTVDAWSGLMAQAGHSAPADSFVPGDVKTARMLGRHFAESLNRVLSRA